jgi:hypothetical protein
MRDLSCADATCAAPWAKTTFRLLAKQLIFNHRNIARRVATLVSLNFARLFQSEKTGSTPVGSAIDLKRFCPIFYSKSALHTASKPTLVAVFSLRRNCGASPRLTTGVSGIRSANCQLTEFIVLAALVWNNSWSETDKATRGLAGPNRSAGREVARGLLTVRKP